MSYFLCGNTGIINRGCEAIVRSTMEVLTVPVGEVYLATFAPVQDRPMVGELGINMIPYASYPSRLHRYFYALTRRVIKGSTVGCPLLAKPLYSRMKPGDVSLNIGGDTYCYGRPINSIALNKFTSKKGIPNILWCCSIEKSAVENREIFRDLNKYAYIFAREAITVDNLVSCGYPREKIVKCCDPAFFLKTREVPLPDGFEAGNTVGINVSEMVINSDNPAVYKNVTDTIRYILDETDMKVCLIPHVYSIEKNTNDYPILTKIKNDVNDPRVSMVDKEYNCEELKYIISNCRFFIGARTHSTIAAYSTGVPTLVLGYSVKSKGIATDLFGTYKDYVLPYTELTDKGELSEAFKLLVSREEEIKAVYERVLPGYRQSLTDAVKKYIIRERAPHALCDRELCTGCGACAAVCPRGAITMKADGPGLYYPDIDKEKCVDCGLCSRTCPVLERPRDDHGVVPTAYAAVNADDNIREKSSSGGVFSALAESIVAEGGVVFGAAFDDSFKVVHRACRTSEELSALRGSKYVQSDLGTCYGQAEEALKAGKTVLFTGTPCQIGGLYAYLKKDYDNLYTQDIICHGVPAPGVWEKYLQERESAAGGKVKAVSFRDKRSGWHTYSMYMEFEGGAEYTAPVTADAYLRGFISHLYLRPSCGMCAFKQVHRQADITLADFWGVEKLLPEMRAEKGISLAIVHSEKGERLLREVSEKLSLTEVNLKEAVKDNASFVKSTSHSPLREAAVRDIRKNGVEKTVTKYMGASVISRARRMIARYF